MTLYPFFFRFGVSFNYSIPKEIVSHLVAYFSEKYNVNIELAKADDAFDCIAIKDTEAKDHSSILALKFKERLEEYGVKDFTNSILFIDIKRTYSDKFIDNYLIPELINIKKDHLNSSTPNTVPNFILFFDELDNHSLTYDVLFTSQAKVQLLDSCFIFDKAGRVLGSNLAFSEDDTLPRIIKFISTPSLERFQFKLVRKINHFKRVDEDSKFHIACQRFFYEGQNCQDETYQLIKDELIQLRINDDTNPHLIIFDPFSNDWFFQAGKAVTNHLSSVTFSSTFSNLSKRNFNTEENYLNIRDKNDSRNKSDWKDDRPLEIIFLSEMIHTGVTFKKRIKEISKKFPNAKLHCLSALITEGAFKDFHQEFNETERKIKINQCIVKYFKKVEQIYTPKSANRVDCPVCRHQLLPLAEVSAPINGKLSSFEMWLMSEEAGYKLEDYRPRKNREDVNRIVPNSLALFKKNGTLLAIKFEQQLKENIPLLAEEVVVIFPDESKNDPEGDPIESIETTPSGYLAKCLNFYNENYSYLGIPRKMIRQLEDSSDFEKVKTSFSKILSQIDDIDKPIVIIDEVNYSGKTFMTICDLLHQLGKNPLCYFPIFNFDVKGTNKHYEKADYEDVKFLSLYQFDYIHE